MPKLSDWQPGKQLQVLVYGQSKTGKTFGAGTFPRPVFMDFDRGIATLAGRDFVAKWGRRELIYEQFREPVTGGLRGVVSKPQAFDDACRFFDKMMSKDHINEFDTWVVDSATTLSELAMNKAIQILGGSKLSQTFEQAQKHGLVTPKQQDFGAERSLVEQFVDMLKSADKHFVLICHEKELSNDQGIVTAIGPLLTGQSMERIPLKFDEVWRLRARKVGLETQRYLVTQPDGIARAGSRYGIPNETEWSYDAVMSQLSSNNSTKKDS